MNFLLLQLVVLFCVLATAMGWSYGRATFYGNEPWYWPIHRGSCGFGYLCKDEGTGWDVAAISDQHWAYSYSCGLCFEFKCNPADFTDGFGQKLDRSQACYDPDASLVASVVDTCPCNYANNAYSNRRWCCGDTDHFDLSVWAFEKLSDLKLGVISVWYRQVECSYQPQKKAYSPTGEHWGEDPGSYGVSCPRNNFPKYNQKESTPTMQDLNQYAEPVSPGVVDHASAAVLYSGDQQGEFQLDSWNADAWEVEDVGLNGGKGICGRVYPGGAISLKGNQGSFTGKMSLEFWTRVEAGLAKAAINIQGAYGSCEPLLFHELSVAEYKSELAKYQVTLEQFVDGDTNRDPNNPFYGCGYNSPEQIERVSFHNYEYYEQYFCIDEVVLKHQP